MYIGLDARKENMINHYVFLLTTYQLLIVILFCLILQIFYWKNNNNFDLKKKKIDIYTVALRCLFELKMAIKWHQKCLGLQFPKIFNF